MPGGQEAQTRRQLHSMHPAGHPKFCRLSPPSGVITRAHSQRDTYTRMSFYKRHISSAAVPRYGSRVGVYGKATGDALGNRRRGDKATSSWSRESRRWLSLTNSRFTRRSLQRAEAASAAPESARSARSEWWCPPHGGEEVAAAPCGGDPLSRPLGRLREGRLWKHRGSRGGLAGEEVTQGMGPAGDGAPAGSFLEKWMLSRLAQAFGGAVRGRI